MPFTPAFSSTAFPITQQTVVPEHTPAGTGTSEVIEPDFPGLTTVKPLGLFRTDGTLALLINFFTHH